MYHYGQRLRTDFSQGCFSHTVAEQEAVAGEVFEPIDVTNAICLSFSPFQKRSGFRSKQSM